MADAYRHFELENLLSEALIAIEARDWTAADSAVKRAMRWVEAEWLGTPAPPPIPIPLRPDPGDDSDDD